MKIARGIFISSVFACLTFFSACEKAPEDVHSAAERILKELNAQKSVEMTFEAVLTANLSGSDAYGNEFSDTPFDLKQSTNIQCSRDPLVVYSSGTSDQTMAGSSVSSDINMYELEENGSKVLYSQYDDQWIKFSGSENIIDTIENILSAIAKDKIEAEADEAFLDTKSDVCTINTAVTPEFVTKMTSTLDSFLGVINDHSDNETLPVSVTFTVDKKTWLLQKVELDLKDYGNQVIEGTENIKGEFSQCSWKCDSISYDSKETISVPDDVKNQAIDLTGVSNDWLETEAETNDNNTQSDESAVQNEDGQYEINDRNSDAKALVTLPSGFQISDSSEYAVTCINDSSGNIVYQFLEGYSQDTIMEEYASTMAYLKDDENYSNVMFGEVKNSPCGEYTASYMMLQYTLDDVVNVEYFISIPVEDSIFVCQIYALQQENDALVQDILKHLSFQ